MTTLSSSPTQFLILSALVAIAVAAPRTSYKENDYESQAQQHQQQHQYQAQHHGEQKHIPIVKFESEQTKSAYKFGYESANGIQVVEHGQVKNEGQKDEANVAEGFYAYKGDDGKEYSVQYIADENGFRAVGDHLPTPVPLPEENQKLIAEVYARPTSKYDEEDYGHYEEEQENVHHKQQIRVQHQQPQKQQAHHYQPAQAAQQQYHAHQQYEH